MVTKEEFLEWRSMNATQEFFKYLGECKQNLLEQSTLRETGDLTIQATAFRDGQVAMANSMMEVDFAGD